jgi:putative membrane protein
MLSISDLPHLNAILNGVAGCFLLGGFIFIKFGNRHAHRLCMISALIVSSLFLISYVTLRFYAPIFVFQGEGLIRAFYYTLLVSHVFLAIAIVPLVSITVIRALKDRFTAHKKIARLTWPIWMYVSISGIVVYLMLYQFYPLKTV